MNLTQDELKILLELVSKLNLNPGQPNFVPLALISASIVSKLTEELNKQTEANDSTVPQDDTDRPATDS
jgi:hypothetical protein